MSDEHDTDHVSALTATQRQATVAVLDGLSPSDWDRPTPCEGWTVAHLTAHMSMSFRVGITKLVLTMVRERGNFDRAADRLARDDVARMAHVELVAALRHNVTTAWSPPGGDLVDALCHDVVHGLDLTEGLERPTTATEEQLDLVLRTMRTKNRMEYFGADLAGHALQASDLDFRIGHGDTLVLPATAIVLILTGRESVHDHLVG
ncbi:maleylpyruvate isomerase family mycothiol-dependent enzyme [Rhodococcoides corynebacterioides]|uniref:Maleylpyruvate isomerase family mycothiol-dependent enzyme n=1 Tax=Rhodococcoides corynebacterioides TaxID=53972 RepID=A0ABS7P1W8_9NOCA|nr:maleylpyruvate isomerase family mycothiol-dependent enzyme [Rhodococcus corynebacterioides]MBY6348972.1 maleylpyruvate isomerase family mycothiol-dependent enzyme [Rhodococcus corynebacterioides]MBY6365211.1 maleylpyruvate isomerase family mycothiol-dependent enzyme [Rhodococcus corynebacterioides]MBY6406623.1 maleylpyruvate isomerase family mycothiol-dependent enzyme [Rhodococcus corynebacterioides]